MAGEPPAGREPNCIEFPPEGFPPTGPPFGMCPEAPAALIVTEGFRLWSPTPELELAPVLPLIMVGVPTVGTAGRIGPLPFTEEMEPVLRCGTGPRPPTAAGVFEVPEVDVGENDFLVALA
jgi:hypothetical protein